MIRSGEDRKVNNVRENKLGKLEDPGKKSDILLHIFFLLQNLHSQTSWVTTRSTGELT